MYGEADRIGGGRDGRGGSGGSGGLHHPQQQQQLEQHKYNQMEVELRTKITTALVKGIEDGLLHTSSSSTSATGDATQHQRSPCYFSTKVVDALMDIIADASSLHVQSGGGGPAVVAAGAAAVLPSYHQAGILRHAVLPAPAAAAAALLSGSASSSSAAAATAAATTTTSASFSNSSSSSSCLVPPSLLSVAVEQGAAETIKQLLSVVDVNAATSGVPNAGGSIAGAGAGGGASCMVGNGVGGVGSHVCAAVSSPTVASLLQPPFAVDQGRLDVVAMLLAAGADPNCNPGGKRLPCIHLAVSKPGRMAIFRTLLKHNANGLYRDSAGNSAWHYAVKSLSLEALRLLQRHMHLTPPTFEEHQLWLHSLTIAYVNPAKRVPRQRMVELLVGRFGPIQTTPEDVDRLFLSTRLNDYQRVKTMLAA
eukprot:gene23485-21480_t